MRYVVAFVLLVAQTSFTAAAQQPGGQVSGVVRDATGAPLANVDIALADTTRVVSRTTTSDSGAYRLDVSPTGPYRLTARANGFHEWTQDVQIVANTPIQVDVVMLLGYADRAVVSASFANDSLMKAPAAVTIVTQAEIANSPVDSVVALLRGVPGLNIAQLGARDVEVNARGASGILSNAMLVTVDGRSFNQPFYGATYWDLLSISKDEIADIEVVRTPASAVWGANAMNGVINVRTKSPRELIGLRGQFGAGGRGTLMASAIWAAATDRVSYKLSGSYYEQDAWARDNTLPDGTPMRPGFTFENRGTKQPKLEARVDWDGSATRLWSLSAGLAGANGLQHSALGPGEFKAGSYYDYVSLERRSSSLDLRVYWNHSYAPYRIVLYDLPEKATGDTYVGEVVKRFTAPHAQNLTIGGSLRLDHFDVSIAPDDHGRGNGAAFVEDKISVNAKVDVVAGARVEKYDTTETVFAPRVGVVLTPRPTHSFRATYNRAYRAPSLLENFVNVSIFGVLPTEPPFYYPQFVQGSTDLAMEKQDAVELGYTGVLNAHTTVFATVYTQTTGNDIWFLPTDFYTPGNPPPLWPVDPSLVPLLFKTFSFMNLAEVRNRGIELATKMDWPRLTGGRRLAVQGSYTFQADPRLESDVPVVINRPSRHRLAGSATYETPRWNASGEVHYTDRAFWADVFTPEFWGYTNAYTSVDARASYHRPADARWEVWLAGTNLLDQKIKTHVYGDTIRRKVTMGVNWRWNR
jgi:outer membrane receptor protein involved in Fe transport